ncbi:MAG: prolyl oligopeptidase family serine peptidase [Candidatus Marinimicrobia bacterium]|nr:prolyl oligopeptidase family serine peptidase [Candidatus Neomarinimicrobiota bacterium]
MKSILKTRKFNIIIFLLVLLIFNCEKKTEVNKFQISDSVSIAKEKDLTAITEKIPLDYSVYKKWKKLENPKISNNGKYVSFEINPKKGDGNLYITNVQNGRKDTIPRGYNAKFSPNSDLIVFKIKPHYDSLRNAKLDDVKKDKLPKDSLGILIFKIDSLIKKSRVKSFKIAKEKSSWIAYQFEKELEEKTKKDSANVTDSVFVADTSVAADTSKIAAIDSSKTDDSKKKQEGTKFVVFNPTDFQEYEYKNIDEYTISKNGKIIGFTSSIKDSTDSIVVNYFNTESQEYNSIFTNEGYGKKVTVDEQGAQLSFLYSQDTTKEKTFCLKYNKIGRKKIITIVDTLTESISDNWSVSEHGKIHFSESGEKLYFGVAKIPEPEPEDTLLEKEKVKVDVWNWKDPYLQTQQLHDLEKEKKRSYLTVYKTDKNKIVQLADENVPEVRLINNGDGNVALGISDKPYRQLISWDSEYKDVYLIDVNSGKKKLIVEKNHYGRGISPDGKYIYWYCDADSSWYTYSIRGEEIKSITKNINTNFYNELHDRPRQPAPYGIAGWTKDDKYALIYDRYDIWKVDPNGKKKAVNVTEQGNKGNSIKFRYVKLDKKAHFIDSDKKILLEAFNEKTKQNGFYSLVINDDNSLKKLIFEDYLFRTPQKAKDSDKLIWQKGNYKKYPELRVSNLDFSNTKKLSLTNPQQKKYIWGTVELMDWTNLEGKKLQGLLYKPENFDSTKKYPMLVYFYERRSNGFHYHYTPSPSRSTISKIMYPSNGYLVFIPDIIYKNGHPGQSAYNCIVSGVSHLIDKYDFINKDKIGIQGQSWGGYQVAYLVTKTNMFAAAMAGAPVSNMTSAYGGIRWGSGLSRMMQYEKGQSRIGGTLWEKPLLYLENSPLFQADDISTPLLIMHNTNDGAVPWYQGIEFFVALRRLQKPVWMLSYNDDSHNLKSENWGNRVDLSIRMRQFFDHYLKDEPAPVWLEKGIPAIDKGKELGYELVDEK